MSLAGCSVFWAKQYQVYRYHNWNTSWLLFETAPIWYVKIRLYQIGNRRAIGSIHFLGFVINLYLAIFICIFVGLWRCCQRHKSWSYSKSRLRIISSRQRFRI
jgi:hypothetical protein